MDWKQLLRELEQATGPRVRELMQRLSNEEPSTAYKQALRKSFQEANTKRQGSLAYLLILAGAAKKQFAKHANPIVREAAAKALLQKPDEKDCPLIEERLEKEEGFRIKKIHLHVLANIATERAQAILKNYQAEPALYLEKQKLLPEEEYTPYSFSPQAKVVVQVVSGLESLWLEAHKLKGKLLAPGWLALEQASFNFLQTCRSIYSYGELITPEFSGSGSVAILYTNTITKEKTLLNQQAASLQTTVHIHPKSAFTLRLLQTGAAVITTSPEKEKQKEFLPASIQDVVAATLALIEPQKVSTVLDPFCGSGTLLLEHVQRYPFAQVRGFEKNDDALRKAKINLREKRSQTSLQLGDARRLPLHERSIERIVTNPPFNIRVKEKSIDELYKKFFKEAERVLEVGGIIILYTVKKEAVERCLQRKKKLQLKKRFNLTLDKIQPSVFVLEKRVH